MNDIRFVEAYENLRNDKLVVRLDAPGDSVFITHKGIQYSEDEGLMPEGLIDFEEPFEVSIEDSRLTVEQRNTIKALLLQFENEFAEIERAKEWEEIKKLNETEEALRNHLTLIDHPMDLNIKGELRVIWRGDSFYFHQNQVEKRLLHAEFARVCHVARSFINATLGVEAASQFIGNQETIELLSSHFPNIQFVQHVDAKKAA